jgi:hypothetical protein
MRPFSIAAIAAGASLLVMSHSAIGQPGVLSTEQPARTAEAQPSRAQPAHSQTAPARLARIQPPAPPCCRRVILLGIAY